MKALMKQSTTNYHIYNVADKTKQKQRPEVREGKVCEDEGNPQGLRRKHPYPDVGAQSVPWETAASHILTGDMVSGLAAEALKVEVFLAASTCLLAAAAVDRHSR